jgi:hypothetical protein
MASDIVDRSRAIRDAHKRFRRGDHVETAELRILLKNIKAAIPFLLSGPEYGLALGQARRDEITIEGYIEARKKKAG